MRKVVCFIFGNYLNFRCRATPLDHGDHGDDDNDEEEDDDDHHDATRRDAMTKKRVPFFG